MVPFDSQAVLSILDDSDVRISSREYIKKIKDILSISNGSAKKILQQLINDQELTYHYLYGNTYIEKSFLRPVHISDHFTLCPPGFSNPVKQNSIPVIVHQGISFGSGQHPTTQLCLKALDYSFFKNPQLDLHQALFGADIGTGSGVLALAMCLAGLSKCNAYEIDPISVNEAKKNITLNKLENKIALSDTIFTENKNYFSIICANLRWPTLNSLANIIHSSLKENGIAVLSGVRAWEKDALIELYTKKGFALLWHQDKKKWSGFVLIKKLC